MKYYAAMKKEGSQYGLISKYTDKSTKVQSSMYTIIF